jgi:aryl-alcohol dehydrogenase-like predicted oxidoreductase
MEYRQLGSSEIRVSELCIGTMTFGCRNTEQESHAQLDLAIANGINFIDTAELYPAPVSAQTTFLTETIVGSWLKHQPREKVVVATKVVGPAPKKWIGHIRGGPTLTEQQITEAVDGSLRRLNTDYIDLFQIHWPARKTNYFGKLGYEVGHDKHDHPIAETVDVLGKLVASGKVRSVGVSNETPWGLHSYISAAAAAAVAPVVSIQNPYCLLNRTFEIGLAEFSHREGIGLLAYSPLAGGALTGKYLGNQKPQGARLTLHENYFYRYTTTPATEAVARYIAIAEKHGHTPADMALAFVRQQPFVASTILGATSTEQLQANIDSRSLRLSDECLKDIQQVHMLNPNPCP